MLAVAEASSIDNAVFGELEAPEIVQISVGCHRKIETKKPIFSALILNFDPKNSSVIAFALKISNE